MTTFRSDGGILVTGATGQVGHELVRELSSLGPVLAPGRETMNLARPDDIRSAIRSLRPRLVVNAGAYTAVDRAESDAVACAAINAEAPRVLAEEVARIGGALVHYSTDYVFDGSKTGAYTEADAPNPVGVYGETKLAGERAIAETGVPHLILRTSWVYGVRGNNFMRTMLRLARERETLRVVADQVGTPTWSRSLAVQTAQLLAILGARDESLVGALATVSGVFHLSAAGATSWHGFAEAILRGDPRRDEHRVERVEPIASGEYPTPARRPPNSVLDNAKVRETFGLRTIPWDEQLAMALAEL
jgi:dTDP-4-dehydrorhamnose reductase